MTMEHFSDTSLHLCHQKWQQDKGNCNIKIRLYYWLLIYVHMSKPISGLDRVTEIVPNFYPPPFGLTTKGDLGLTSLFIH